jgi:hypothetical protein
MVAWLLYQGTLLMTVLNFTGLFVNGLVCFVLPLLLVLKAMECSSSSSISSHQQQYISIDESVKPIDDDDDDDDDDNALAEDKEAVHPLSPSIEPYRRSIAQLLLVVFAIIVIWSCILIVGGRWQSR